MLDFVDDPSRWQVLVVDNDVDNLDVAEQTLDMYGAKTFTAISGRIGLDILKEVTPSFILLDLSMPEMDGWEVLREIRANPAYNSIPVIALTAHAMVGDREHILAAGFDGYISKPFDISTVVSEIQGMLRAFAR